MGGSTLLPRFLNVSHFLVSVDVVSKLSLGGTGCLASSLVFTAPVDVPSISLLWQPTMAEELP